MHNPMGFMLITDEEYINEFLNEFKTSEDVNNIKLQKYFSHQRKKLDKGGYKIEPPLYYTSDEFILKKDTLPNVKEDTQTTFGIYIFNLFCISEVFQENLEYVNPKSGLTSKEINKLMKKITDGILSGKYTTKQFIEFQNRCVFLGYKGTLFTPGQSFEFVKVNKKVSEAKPKLLKEWREAVENGADPISSYVSMVETPLLNIAKEDLKNNESWPIYARGGKPAFGNVYKNCTVTMGPVYNPSTGEYTVAENSFMEGIENDMVPVFSNIQISAAYARAVGTQDGGWMTKLVFSGMQSTILDEKGSNCGTKLFIKKLITEDNISQNIFRYIVDEESKKIIKLTYENYKKYIGKVVKMRSPLFCKSDKICNVCAGDYFYKIGIKNVGNTCTKTTSTMMNKSLKAMHDVSMKIVKIKPFDYIVKLS